MRRGAASRRCDGQQGRAHAHNQSPAQDTGETAPAGLAQLIEKKKSPKNAEKAIGIPQRKGDAQANVTNGENSQRVGHGPEASGKKRPYDQVRRPATIGEMPMETSFVGASAAPSQAPAAKPQRMPSSCSFFGRDASWIAGGNWEGETGGILLRSENQRIN